MTSHSTWDPSHSSYAQTEQALHDDLHRGFHLDRQIGAMRPRGQDASDTIVDFAEQRMHPMGGNAPVDGNASKLDEVPDSGDTVEDVDPRMCTLKALQRQQDYAGVSDIDKYADALMKELGVTENATQTLAAKLASATTRKKRPGFVEPQQLARNWKIGLEAAKRTVEATTQLAVRDFSNTTGGRRLKPRHWLLEQKLLQCPVYHDTFFARCKSLRGNTCASVFASSFQYIRVKAMASKGDSHFNLDDFFHKVGVQSTTRGSCWRPMHQKCCGTIVWSGVL